MKKIFSTLILIVLVIIAVNNSTLHAGSFNFKIGLFHPNLDSDLWEVNIDNLAFDKKDMQDSYYGLEYEHHLNRYVSVALEGGYYFKEHYSFYRDYEYDDGSPIFQNLALRIVSVEADIKLYPLGNRQRFSPYVGGGVGMYFWKYEQWGDFIDFELGVVDEEVYAESTTNTVGFNAKGGFIIRVSRNIGVSFETKYQYLKGQLSSFFEGWEKLDMSGFVFTLGLNFFFR